MFEATLKQAKALRQNFASFQGTEMLRVFYGPGESDHPVFRHLAVDQFQNYFWITAWASIEPAQVSGVIKALNECFPDTIGMVWMDRSEVASEATAKCVFGKCPNEKFAVHEFGVPYWVQLEGTKHPGIFLDHAELRRWLLKSQAGKKVLNLFSYTGSLSVAAGRAGAAQVTTVDLSKATIDWAKENWELASLDSRRGDFIYGDAFEWLPKFKKRGDQLDTILCDPPSFSRSKAGTFSTNKDSARLHELIFPLLKPGGILVSSINSQNYSERHFLKDIETAARATQTEIRVLKRVDLPETFPTGTDLQARYLKGFYILKV